jgi:serine/threonine protein kinase
MQMGIITAVHVLNPLMIYFLLFCMVMGWASSNKLKLQLLMLEQMRHPNIVQFLCAVTRSQPIVIVTEYLPGGKLNDIISKGRIPTRKALSFALDIARYTPSFAL